MITNIINSILSHASDNIIVFIAICYLLALGFYFFFNRNFKKNTLDIHQIELILKDVEKKNKDRLILFK